MRLGAMMLGVAPLMASAMTEAKPKRKLAFSTIGCPDWSLEQILVFAKANGYGGIEFRGIQRELDLTKTKAFQSAQDRNDSKAKMKEHGLQFVALAASSRLHIKDPAGRHKELDEAKRFIDLAAEVNCPYVRVFGDKLPATEEKRETLDRITEGLLELGNYAKGTPVKVLLETHGDVVYTSDVHYIMKASTHPSIGLLWDFFNMWIVTGESVAEAYRQLSPYIKHVQIKDGHKTANGYQLTLVGQGSSPLSEALKALAKSRYKGFYSLEWEKLWHPELPAPETAFKDYASFMKNSRQ